MLYSDHLLNFSLNHSLFFFFVFFFTVFFLVFFFCLLTVPSLFYCFFFFFFFFFRWIDCLQSTHIIQRERGVRPGSAQFV